MKRISSAFFISAIILFLTLFGNTVVSTISKQYGEQLKKVEYYAQTENQVKANREIDSLISGFHDKRHLLEMFIKRDYISNLFISIEGLKAYADSETWRDLESEAAKAREQLSSLKHLYFSII